MVGDDDRRRGLAARERGSATGAFCTLDPCLVPLRVLQQSAKTRNCTSRRAPPRCPPSVRQSTQRDRQPVQVQISLLSTGSILPRLTKILPRSGRLRWCLNRRWTPLADLLHHSHPRNPHNPLRCPPFVSSVGTTGSTFARLPINLPILVFRMFCMFRSPN
jgi:hypothetical protein